MKSSSKTDCMLAKEFVSGLRTSKNAPITSYWFASEIAFARNVTGLVSTSIKLVNKCLAFIEAPYRGSLGVITIHAFRGDQSDRVTVA